MDKKRKLIVKIKRVPGLRVILRALLRTKIFLRQSFSYVAEGISWLLHSRETTNITGDLTPNSERFLSAVVALATNSSVEEVVAYFNELKADSELQNAYKVSIASHADGFVTDSTPRYGRRLAWYALTRILKPKVVIETGVDKGLGSLILAAALIKNTQEGFEGHHYGTDINPHAGYLITGKYAKFAEVLVGDSIESLEAFDRPIDLFISDSDHDPNYELREYETVASKLAEKAIVISDQGTDCLMKFSQARDRKFFFFHDKTTSAWTPNSGIGVSWVD